MKNNDPEVYITSSGFVPYLLIVNPGDIIMFQNQDNKPHSVACDETPEIYDSGEIAPDSALDYTAEEVGTFVFYCKLHPSERITITIGEGEGEGGEGI